MPFKSVASDNPSLEDDRSISRTLRSFLYHVNVASGLPAVAVHVSLSTVPAVIVVPSSYPVTVSLEGGSTNVGQDYLNIFCLIKNFRFFSLNNNIIIKLNHSVEKRRRRL